MKHTVVYSLLNFLKDASRFKLHLWNPGIAATLEFRGKCYERRM